MKRAVLYLRVSTIDQHPETQVHDLRAMAAQRGYQIQHEYRDVISGAKARRPGLDQLLADARKHRFDVVLVWGLRPAGPLSPALPRSLGRTQPPADRVHQF